MPQVHTCGRCAEVYDTEAGYIDHTCGVTGYKPSQLEHHGTLGVLVAKAALERGKSLTEERKAALDKQLADIKAAEVDDKIGRAEGERLRALKQ